MRHCTLPNWRHAGYALFVVALMLSVSGAQAADTDLVITEIMQNPAALADADGEWFEVHNTGPDPIDIQGWTISDNDSDSHLIPTGTPIIVAAGAYEVLGINATAMATQGVTLLYQYSGIAIANGADELVLTNASAVEIDRVEYDGGIVWPDPTGASMQWDEASGDNNVGTNWYAPDTPTFGDGDAGTPGAANQIGGGTAPNIANVIHRPIIVEPATPAVVTADVTDNDGTITSVNLYVQLNGGGFVSQPMSLDTGDTYTATIAGQALATAVDYYVEATDNDGFTVTSPSTAPAAFYSYTVQNKVITPIADIHADLLTYENTIVTVQAQVYGPGNYQADGTSVSAYIQDGSNRGLNVFGTFLSTGGDLLNDTGNIVEVTGTVTLYFTTVELEEYEVTLISSGNPDLTPVVYNTADAALPSNEGTFIESSGPITNIATTGGLNPAYNFTVDDGSGPLVIRVDEDLDPGLASWQLGDVIEAAGAGATFSSQGQIIVTRASQLANLGPASLEVQSAVLTGPQEVTVTFNQDVDATTGGNAANYEVFETLTPGNTIAVSSATVQVDASQVVLNLGSAPSNAILYTLRINNVEDLLGTPIAPDTEITLFNPNTPVVLYINEVMQNPNALSDSDGEWFEVYNAGVGPVDVEGWTIRDDGFDSHVINHGGPLVINPGEYVVFTRNAVAMAGEGVTSFYNYGSDITLGNSDDELYLVDLTPAIVTGIQWDGGLVWPDPTGASMQWNGTGDNNDGANWYYEGFPFGSGDLGSPGATNAFNPAVDAPSGRKVTRLDGNVPNPFNPRTSFSFTLARDERVSLKVYDLRGRHVRTVLDEPLKAGSYDRVYSWDGRDDAGKDLPSGTYFFRLATESGFHDAKKMTLLK